MSGRDSYPIFERDSHGFPVRVRWVERNSVPRAFLELALATYAADDLDHRADFDAGHRRPAADPATTSDPHGAT